MLKDFLYEKTELGIGKELFGCHIVVTFNTLTIINVFKSLKIFWLKVSMGHGANSEYITLLPPGKNSQFYMNMKIMWNRALTFFCD